MIDLSALWLPILVSTVIVFIASSIIHMAPLWHKGECPPLPDQERMMDVLRPFGIKPGEYMLPRAKDMKEMKTPEFTEKLKRGPVIVMTVVAGGAMSMNKALVQWLVFVLVVSLFVAYMTSRTLGADADYLGVFRVAGTTAFLAYAAGLWQQSIWYSRPWSTTVKLTLDGLIYALLTGGVFGWLWPAM